MEYIIQMFYQRIRGYTNAFNTGKERHDVVNNYEIEQKSLHSVNFVQNVFQRLTFNQLIITGLRFQFRFVHYFKNRLKHAKNTKKKCWTKQI